MTTFRIDAEQIPSKAFSITFKEPTFEDRRKVSRSYPVNSRANYSLEQLLLANSITAVNDEDINKSIPADPVQILREIPLLDQQFILSVFLSMFTCDKDMLDLGKSIGLEKKLSLETFFTIPANQMPSGSKSVTLRKPHTGDQMELDRRYQGSDSNCGYSLEEMLFAHCLAAVNGEQVQPSKDTISVLDEWTHLDAQFAMTVFVNASTIDAADADTAKQLGKSLRAIATTSTDSTKSASKSTKGTIKPTALSNLTTADA